MNKPNFFIVGEGKSGTTAIANFLAQHPEVFITEPKEPHFFCSDLHKESDAYHGKPLFYQYRNEESYLKLFNNGQKAKALGEGSVSYLTSKVAAQSIKTFNPKAKIIISLREPSSYLYSFYLALRRTNQETAKTFAEALELERERKNGRFLPKHVMQPSYVYYSERLNYYDKVKRYWDIFDPEDIKIIEYGYLKNNNEQVIRELCNFLAISTDITKIKFSTVNVYGEPRSVAMKKILFSKNIRTIAEKLLPPKAYWRMSKFITKKLFKPVFKEPIDQNVKENIQLLAKNQVHQLAELTGIDFMKIWKYDKL